MSPHHRRILQALSEGRWLDQTRLRKASKIGHHDFIPVLEELVAEGIIVHRKGRRKRLGRLAYLYRLAAQKGQTAA